MNMDLTGKRAVVCGSTQGIGEACAKELALLGASITLVARNEDALNKTRLSLDQSKGQQHEIICADFNDPMLLKEKIVAYVKEGRPAHILINNTGGPPGGPAHSAEVEAFEKAFSQHLICNQILVQGFLDGMKKEGYGRIINIISTSVKEPIADLGVSNTIRGAVANWSKTLARELGPFQITVNNVLPGGTNTARLQQLIEKKAKASNLPEEEVLKQAEERVPLKRMAQPEEIANAVAFLASPAGSYVNGINFPVDGGRTGCL